MDRDDLLACCQKLFLKNLIPYSMNKNLTYKPCMVHFSKTKYDMNLIELKNVSWTTRVLWSVLTFPYYF